jgi:hypothetical protein
VSSGDDGSFVHICRCFPSQDEAFVAFVEACSDSARNGGMERPEALERLIRTRYERAVVRPQSDLAASRSMRVWYVYRDGSAFSVADD